MTLPTTDHAHGIERNPDSPMSGKLVLGGKGQIPIMLWREPGLPIKAENFTGAVAHGQELQVLRMKEHDGAEWYYVKCVVKHEGKSYPQKGWIRRPLLKELGNDTNSASLDNRGSPHTY